MSTNSGGGMRHNPVVLWLEPHRSKGETHYGALGAPLGSEKQSGGGGHPYLGVCGCGEAVVCPRDGRTVSLCSSGRSTSSGSFRGLRRSFMAWWQGSGGRDLVRHR
jgi:hypothetical protein